MAGVEQARDAAAGARTAQGARTAPEGAPRRWPRALALGLLLALALDQLVLLFALRDGELLGNRIAPFDPPIFWEGQAETLARIEEHVAAGRGAAGDFDHDAELGWGGAPSTGAGQLAYDWIGARLGDAPFPRERRAGELRAGAFGCSFTMGTEVAAADAWPAVLDAREGLAVANLGMAAYGLDQAFLRWRRVAGELDADEVWLGFLPAASLRNLSMYWPAMRHWTTTVATKPRFELAPDGALQLVPNPAETLADLVALLHDQARFFEALARDVWVERVPDAYAPAGSRALHRLALGRVWLTLRDRRGRDPRPWLVDETSEATRLVRAIVLAMRAEVEASGARFRLLVLPSRPDLVDRREHGGRGFWEDVTGALAADGVDVLDVSDALLAAEALESSAVWAPGGHYSERGNRVVADALAARLERDG